MRLTLVRETRPGAWKVDPPLAKSGPRSSTVTSVRPRAVSSSATEAPTTPAPTTTTRGLLLIERMLPAGATPCSSGRCASFLT